MPLNKETKTEIGSFDVYVHDMSEKEMNILRFGVCHAPLPDNDFHLQFAKV